VIYVNAGCTRLAPRWLDGLADGGRLILPLTSDQGFMGGAPGQVARSGAVFRIRREGPDYHAAWISPVAIIPCDGGRDAASEQALADAFAGGGWQKVTRLYRDSTLPDERCWLRGDGWCLAYD
jgi:protein-L-isoaspartate(D-aspartate) O-methyltransferase